MPANSHKATRKAESDYQDAFHRADSIRPTDDQECRVYPGSNGGYFIEAYGKSYRFASVESKRHIAELFLAIVSWPSP